MPSDLACLEYPDTDFAQIAESMGGLGLTVEKPGEFEGALDQAIASGRPAMIDVKIDIGSITPGAWAP